MLAMKVTRRKRKGMSVGRGMTGKDVKRRLKKAEERKQQMAEYSKMTQDDFDNHLEKVVKGMSTAELLAVPGVRLLLGEELNNEVLESWEAEQDGE